MSSPAGPPIVALGSAWRPAKPCRSPALFYGGDSCPAAGTPPRSSPTAASSSGSSCAPRVGGGSGRALPAAIFEGLGEGHDAGALERPEGAGNRMRHPAHHRQVACLECGPELGDQRGMLAEETLDHLRQQLPVAGHGLQRRAPVEADARCVRVRATVRDAASDLVMAVEARARCVPVGAGLRLPAGGRIVAFPRRPPGLAVPGDRRRVPILTGRRHTFAATRGLRVAAGRRVRLSLLHHGGDRVEELPRPVRLQQEPVEAGGEAPGLVAARRPRGQGQYRRRTGALRLLAPPDGGGRRVAVHPGHLEVHEDHVVPFGRASIDRRHAVADGAHPVARPLEEPDRHPLVGDGVLDEEHAQRDPLDDRLADRRGLVGAALREPEPGGEMERAALPRLALQAHGASEGIHEAGGDGQPQAGAPVAPGRRRVGLHELLEDRLLLARRYADAGVGHVEAEHDAVVDRIFPPDVQRDRAPPGELDGVRQEVREDLPQQPPVAHHRVRDVGVHVVRQLDVLAVKAGRERLHEGVEALAQAKRVGLDDELARLHLREVEDVVDDVEQRVGRLAQGVEMLALPGRQIGLAEQLGHPDDPVEGRADLVADVGEEDALGPVGAFGPVLRLAQLLRLAPQVLLGALERGHVGVAAEQADGLALLVADGEAAAAHPHRTAVAVAVADDLVVGMVGVGEVLGEVVEGEVAVLREDVGHPPLGGVGNLVVAIAEELLEAGAHPLLVLALDVPVPDAVERAGLQELEDRRVLAHQLVELGLQVVLVLGHAAPAVG